MSIATPRKRTIPAKNGKVKTVSVPVIDYPREGDTISSGHYAIRLSANAPQGLEISMNDGPWQKCRHAVGHFWFDWVNPSKGRHTIVARTAALSGRPQKSLPRTCEVI